jgi:hypothetical protein
MVAATRADVFKPTGWRQYLSVRASVLRTAIRFMEIDDWWEYARSGHFHENNVNQTWSTKT